MREILLGERDAGEACSVSGDNKDDDDSSSVAKSLSLALLGLLLVAFM